MHPRDLFPDWPRPPYEGFTTDDLFRLPGLPAHTQLLDGSFVFAACQSFFHSGTTDLLVGGLRGAAPADLRVLRQMVMLVDARNAPEPDVAVVRRMAACRRDQMSVRARDVLLAVEVVSPESEARDRDTKPHKYAGAGIPYFWRVEMAGVDDRPTVHVFELGKEDRTYHSVAIHHDRLKLTTPFDIDIDLTEIENL
ncbi:Uma2 family endonuclease [Streptomyces sclerotialus]|uniref:Uma2 family endonuclease n=1 Tax=Streptomyces sclerotialus TaxID=1957 RepID=UPI0004C5F321